jgi:hypothetical protein
MVADDTISTLRRVDYYYPRKKGAVDPLREDGKLATLAHDSCPLLDTTRSSSNTVTPANNLEAQQLGGRRGLLLFRNWHLMRDALHEHCQTKHCKPVYDGCADKLEHRFFLS